MDTINVKIHPQDMELKDKIVQIVSLFEAKAKKKNITFELRK